MKPTTVDDTTRFAFGANWFHELVFENTGHSCEN
jgi:hypothetical protein